MSTRLLARRARRRRRRDRPVGGLARARARHVGDGARARDDRRGEPRTSPRACSRRWPRSEFGEAGRRLLELGLRSAEMWPAFAADVQARRRVGGGADAGPARCCSPATRTRRASSSARSPCATRSGSTRRAPAPQRGARARAGAGADRATGARGPRGPLGRSAPAARRAAGACESTGVRLREHARVARIEARRRRHAGRGAWRSTASGGPRSCIGAGQVVLAAGAWVEQIEGLARGRARAGAPGQGPDPAPARSRRARAPAARRALRGRLSRSARRRPLRARRDGGGARL